MKKLLMSAALLSVAALSASEFLPHDKAKINQMKGQLAHSEGQIEGKHKEIAETREAIARKAAADDTLEKESRQELPEHEVQKNNELQAKLKNCEAERNRLLKEVASQRENIARETAAADIRKKDVQSMAPAIEVD